MKTIKQGVIALAAILMSGPAFGVTNLNFNAVSATSEGAIRLSWNSTTNEVYEIDYADQLVDISQGGPNWQRLYAGYPSHGTNTFWLDTGNYNFEPAIPHPKYGTMRFYRILNLGTNNGPSPFVTITSPTNGAVFAGQVTVSVVSTSSLPLLSTKLFVDGQEMYPSDDGTNYLINTCEWPNGPHTLFATARARSDYSGPNGVFPITIGQAVSAYVPVTFNNLITSVGFSQAFFEPTLGQTQQVSAVFAANVNWTLRIEDDSSNVVQTVTGSGGSLTYNWDGTSTNGVAIPDGVYYYSISAQTNGLPLPNHSSGGGNTNKPPSPGAAFASPSGSLPDSNTIEIQFPPLPPGLFYGLDANGIPITNKTEFIPLPTPPLDSASSVPADSSSLVSASTGFAAASFSTTQTTLAPTRPPTAPVKGKSGTYAIGYYTYPNTNVFSVPKNGIPSPLTQSIHLEGSLSPMRFDPIPEADTTAINMIGTMKKGGWKLAFHKFDRDLFANSVKRSDLGIGGGEIFTGAELGIFMAHGTFGTDPDYNAGASGAQLTYWPSSNLSDGSKPWISMAQFGFGGSLKWMALLACNSICDPNYQSMLSAGAIPLKETHLVLGTASLAAMGENIASYWGQNLLKSQSVMTAWFNAGNREYHDAHINPGSMTNTIVFRVVGYPECFSDSLKTNTAPTNPSPAPGNLVNQDQEVFHYP
jgi:hypothetical protein